MKNVNLTDVSISDSFWTPVQTKVRQVAIPYQEKVLWDQIEGIEPSHAIANFQIAAGQLEGEFYGMVFQDSDVAKWIEGVAYSLAVCPDAELEKRVDEIIDIIEAAQQENGYLDTYFIVKEPDNKWRNLLEGHELYCAGHMIEAGVAYYRTTRKDKLLKVCRRLADHIDEVFGPDKYKGIPGHQEIELALMKLYDLTGEERYCRLAKYFIDQRGQDLQFFVKEKKKRDFDVFGMDPENRFYNQSHLPVRQQKEAVGHAVRALYMYEAMADVAIATGDEELLSCCETLWKDITDTKMFITGGVGSDGSLESFSSKYYLPNDMAYNETCAQIAMFFFSKKLLDVKRDGKYADVMERLAYNSIISGMQFDGKRFFYVNPLEVNPGISGELHGHKHVIPERPGWYACACCPPNLVRMVSSLGQYIWSEDEKESLIFSNMFVGQRAELKRATIEVLTDYPWEGKVTYRVNPGEKFTLAIHKPSYVKDYTLTMDGNDIKSKTSCQKGYLYIEGIENQCEIVLEFPMEVRTIYANERVIQDAGKAAFMRGPVVYAFEEVDNGANIQSLMVCEAEEGDEEVRVEEGQGIFQGMKLLCLPGMRLTYEDTDSLYFEKAPEFVPCELKAIPYFMWGNRGLNQMRVWMPY